MIVHVRTLRRFVGLVMAGVLVLSLVVWYATRDRVPREIRMASASRGGLYHKLVVNASPHIERRTNRPVVVVETEGSSENLALLRSGAVELAILQSGAVSLEGLAVIAPLYHEIVHVIARDGSAIATVRDMEGRSISLGPLGSGMRASALQLLKHYRIDDAALAGSDRYFRALLDDPSIDGAVVTTGLVNPDLEAVLGSGRFRLLPVLDAEAFQIHNPAFTPFVIPRGLYAEGPPVPDAPVLTVATTSVLAARPDVSDRLVEKVLGAVFESDLRGRVPTLFTVAEAGAWTQVPLHGVARRYFDPYGGIDILASFMESLAAGKELLFAVLAAGYLLWDRWRRVRDRARDREIGVLKERLDALLDETIRIERAQIDVTDPDELKGFLDEVTTVKLKAIDELTHEDLRGDRMFHIFLTQCGNLIQKIQAKMTTAAILAQLESIEERRGDAGEPAS